MSNLARHQATQQHLTSLQKVKMQAELKQAQDKAEEASAGERAQGLHIEEGRPRMKTQRTLLRLIGISRRNELETLSTIDKELPVDR